MMFVNDIGTEAKDESEGEPDEKLSDSDDTDAIRQVVASHNGAVQSPCNILNNAQPCVLRAKPLSGW